MEKKYKTLIWVLCAAVIVVGLGVAIYFIVDDALEQKIEGCMLKHFHSTKMLERLNITMQKDPSKIKYSVQECESIVELARKKTTLAIDKMSLQTCMKNLLKQNDNRELVMFAKALERFGKIEAGAKVYGKVLEANSPACHNATAID